MNIYLVIILSALILGFAIQVLANYLNIKSLKTELPEEFEGFYKEDEYKRSQRYTKAKTKFDYLTSSFDFLLLLFFILLGGFNYIDIIVREITVNPICGGLIFFGILYFANDLLLTPFSLYYTFRIEERFGFNKTTSKTFVLDKVKGYVILILIGGPLLGVILFFFDSLGRAAWFYAWLLLIIFTIAAQPLYTMIIAPLFNKFHPLGDGELKNKIEEYAQKVSFPLREIRVMDGSRRSSHSNAYFSGIGKKRIALYDTLMERHSSTELLAIIAHEVGHYKHHHVAKGMIISIAHSGVLLFLLSLFINNRGLFEAFGMEKTSVYASLLFFSLLYSPIEMILSVLMNLLSRKQEYEADRFAASTTGGPDSMILALKNLSISNLSNLTPHWFNVLLNYSHPPVLMRIASLKNINPIPHSQHCPR